MTGESGRSKRKEREQHRRSRAWKSKGESVVLRAVRERVMCWEQWVFESAEREKLRSSECWGKDRDRRREIRDSDLFVIFFFINVAFFLLLLLLNREGMRWAKRQHFIYKLPFPLALSQCSNRWAALYIHSRETLTDSTSKESLPWLPREKSTYN